MDRDELKFPFEIWFAPSADVRDLFPHEKPLDEDGNQIPFYDQLTTIPAGTHLFDVMARTEPNDPENYPDSEVLQIAKIWARSELVTSNFGDARLFFQHEEIDVDEALRPDWEDYAIELDGDDAWPDDRPYDGWPTDPEE